MHGWPSCDVYNWLRTCGLSRQVRNLIEINLGARRYNFVELDYFTSVRCEDPWCGWRREGG